MALLIVALITSGVWVARRPYFLGAIGKLRVSLVLVVIGAAIPFFFPKFLADVAGISPVVIAIIFSLVAVPQGFIGVAIAWWLVTRKPDQQTAAAHDCWWIVSLFGVIWSIAAVLATGVAWADW